MSRNVNLLQRCFRIWFTISMVGDVKKKLPITISVQIVIYLR